MGACINLPKIAHDTPTDTDSYSNAYFQKSVELYQNNQLDEAQAILTVILQIKPDHLKAKELYKSVSHEINDKNGQSSIHSTSHHIHCNISTCIELKRLSNIMSKYNQQKCVNDDDQDVLELLNDFLHLIHKHDKDEEFEFITNRFGHCDINKCNMFKRNNRDRTSIYNDDEINTVYIQIIDKIHCYYQHCYDIGNNLSNSDKETIKNTVQCNEKNMNDSFERYLINNKIITRKKILSSKRKLYRNINERIDRRGINKYNLLFSEQQQNDDNTAAVGIYNFGHMFRYGYHGEDYQRVIYRDVVDIGPKYHSLKEELIIGDLTNISMQSFNNEYEKATIHFNTNFCRESIQSVKLPQFEWVFSIEYLLALMIYCNYDELQHIFSKTYRENNGNKHNNFYYLGEYLKISVKRFGTSIDNGKIKVFYHGITQKLSFPKIAGSGWNDGILIYCPLSTSSSFLVASNFTNNNEGLIVEFCASDSCPLIKYFAVNWLSDYGNEQEHIFLQNGKDERLKIENIVDPQYGHEYKQVLMALRKIRKMFTNNGAPLRYYKKDKNIDDNLLRLIHKIIFHQLSYKWSKYKRFDGLNGYAENLINTYFSNRTKVWMNYVKFKKYHPILVNVFFDPQSQYGWIEIFNMLFPNIEEIGIDHINLRSSTLDNILYHLWKMKDSKIRNIYIGANINSELSVSFAPSIYHSKFEKINFRITHNEHDWLCIESNESIPDFHPLRFLLDEAHIYTKKGRNKKKNRYKQLMKNKQIDDNEESKEDSDSVSN